MLYQDVFVLFWKQVKESVQEGRFAKLTMAKTIGKPNLKNIFLRPVYSDDGFKVLLKFRYRSKETEDIEEKLALEDAFVILKWQNLMLKIQISQIAFQVIQNFQLNMYILAKKYIIFCIP